MARWTDLAQWRGPTPNQVKGHTECRGLVIHIAQGSYEGTIAWQKNPAAEVSSQFVAGKAGQRAQVVDTDDTAWTQSAGNGHWLSVECEGFVPDALTTQQVEFIAQLFARGHLEYGYPLQLATSPNGFGLGHHAMGGDAWGGHPDCPGPNIIAQKPLILARAQAIVGGGDDMTPAQAQQLDDVTWVVDAMCNMRTEVAGGQWKGQPVPIVAAIQGLQTGGVNTDELAAKVAAALAADPTFLAGMAKAVNDDHYRRMES